MSQQVTLRPLHATIQLSTLTAALFFAFNAQAQTIETNPVEELPAMTVTSDWLGSGLENNVKTFPGARSVLRKKDINASGANTVSDALKLVPGVQVSNNASSSGSNIALNIGVRGLEARYSARSTVLVDGLPMSVAPYGQPQLSLASVSLNNIDSIDVVRGGGAVRYGPQNVGGIINFNTRAIPSEAFAADASVRRNQYQGGAGNTQYSAFIGGTNDKIGAAFMYSGSDGANWRDHSEEQIHDAALKLNYDLNAHSAVHAKLSHFEAKSNTPGGLSQAAYAANPFASVRNSDKWNGRRTALDVGYRNSLSDTRELEVRVFGSDSFRQSFLANSADGKATSINNQPRNYKTFGVEPRYTQRFTTGLVTHDVTLGYRYLIERADEQVLARNLTTKVIRTTRSSKNSTDAHALYLDNKIAWGQWQITPGLRFEHIKMGRENRLTNSAQSSTNNKLLPALNVAYRINDDLTAFTNYGTSFGSVQHLQVNLQNSADALKPESAKTVELGARYSKNGLKAELTGFNINFSNQIDYVNTPPVYYKNMGKTQHKGLEAALSYRIDTGKLKGLSAYTTYAYTKATLKSGAYSGNDVPFYSRHTNTLGTRYERGSWSFDVSSTYQSSQYADEANTVSESADGSLGKIPAYRLWNMKLGWKSSQKIGLSITAGINNLLNKQYYTRTTDTNSGKLVGAPRTLFVELKAAF